MYPTLTFPYLIFFMCTEDDTTINNGNRKVFQIRTKMLNFNWFCNFKITLAKISVFTNCSSGIWCWRLRTITPPVVVNGRNPNCCWPNLLAQLLPGTHILTLEGLKAEFPQQQEKTELGIEPETLEWWHNSLPTICTSLYVHHYKSLIDSY